ncbi:UbiD family decarboxylase [Leucobacter ruminantium]|uniref:UbiD family decarboxylase n=1 Tax=Leucobacter ruminantium TaxID=1289170 RepID=A0A939LTK8_9MICO|nr:UbiD family decarboxylase [Leucobacter ruminantium]MBO1804569.1 UbiD family decarboxylase [Leucobacter ruminantium]
MPATANDLRGYLAEVERSGRLRRIDLPVDARSEVGPVLSRAEMSGPILLSDVGGARVLGNLLTTRDEIAAVIGVPGQPELVSERLLEAIRAPVPPREVESGPGDAVVTDDVDLRALPIPEFFSRESGAYITGGIICVTDVVTGERNLSYARFKILGERTAMLGVSPNHHLGRMAARAREAGRSLPIAVVLGVHPALTLAACLYLGFGDDEMEVAGALLGEAVDVRPVCDGSVWAPSHAEIVLEGEVVPGEFVEEGLVSEFHGRYHDYGAGLLTRFTGMRTREDPVLPVVVPGLHREHLILASVPIAAGLLDQLRRIEPGVREVAVPDSGAGRTSAVVSVENLPPGRAKQLMFACWAAVPLIKQVVVVDAEIDPWNEEAVAWARLTHARPERDFLIVPGARTDRSDPQVRDFQVGKLGVDATAKAGDRAEGWEFARFPDGALERADEILRAAGIEGVRSPVNQGVSYGLGERDRFRARREYDAARQSDSRNMRTC